MSKRTSRGKAGETRTESGQTTGKRSAPERDGALDDIELLEKTLLDIGRIEKSIRPERLRSYDRLLTSPEVRRRTASNTDIDQLAQHASTALRDWVGAIADETRCLVMRAALCIDEEIDTDAEGRYEGKKVSQREAKLAETHSITKETFRYQRELGMRELAHFLHQPDPIAASAESSTSSVEALPDNELIKDYTFTILARHAANLHALCLLALFSLDVRLLLRQAFPRKLSDDFYTVSIVDRVLMSYVRLLYWPHTDLRQKLDLLSSTPRDTIKFLLREIGDRTPVGPQSLSDTESREIISTICNREFSAQRDAVIDGKLRKVWRAWYETNRNGFDSHESPLRPIAAASGGIVNILSGCVSFQRPVWQDAESVMYKALASEYNLLDCDAPINNGLSLKQRAEAYVEMESAALVIRATWHPGRLL